MFNIVSSKFNTVNFQGNSFNTREKSSLNLQTQPDTVSFKQNNKPIAIKLDRGLEELLNNAKSLVPESSRKLIEDIADVLIQADKDAGKPVNWQDTAEITKKSLEISKQQLSKTIVNYDEMINHVDIVVGEKHIAAIMEELNTAANKLHKDVDTNKLEKIGFIRFSKPLDKSTP